MESSTRAALFIVLVTACTTGTSNKATPDAAENLGPGAALKCTSSGKDAWLTYGATGFVAVNKAIFANVTSEVTANGSANVGDSFTLIGTGNPGSTTDNLATFEGKLAAFLVYAYGGPMSITYTDGVLYYAEPDMSVAHTGLGITSSQYDYFISSIVVSALTSSGVSTADVSSCFAPIVTNAAFEATIVGQ